jgi:hypothetical protein
MGGAGLAGGASGIGALSPRGAGGSGPPPPLDATLLGFIAGGDARDAGAATGGPDGLPSFSASSLGATRLGASGVGRGGPGAEDGGAGGAHINCIEFDTAVDPLGRPTRLIIGDGSGAFRI